jgi:hypothetical protein
MINFLAWRKENGVDLIRESILRGGLNHPKKFPKGDKVSISSLYHAVSRAIEINSARSNYPLLFVLCRICCAVLIRKSNDRILFSHIHV